jgi:hypothetical protein
MIDRKIRGDLDYPFSCLMTIISSCNIFWHGFGNLGVSEALSSFFKI